MKPFDPFPLTIKGVTITVNCRDAEMTRDAVREKLRAREGFALATLNLDHLVKLRSADAFRTAYAETDLVVADGNPIVWLSRLARRPVSLTPGSDLVVPLTALATEEGVDIALVGATPETLQKAAVALQQQVEGVRIVTRIAPSRDFDPTGDEAQAIIAALGRSSARLVLLALGAPKQEIFAIRARDGAPRIGFVSIGAALDFLAGSKRRAPDWMRRLALEWLWRMASEPRRLTGRYAACAILLPSLAYGAYKAGRRSI